jgi:hypothetical protein
MSISAAEKNKSNGGKCFHKNHGWISGFRVAKKHVSRS